MRKQRGQALIFATMSLPVTFALTGFVVDIGWAHYRRLACQSAAESAAFAGALAAQNAASQSCAGGWTCQSSTACPATLNTPADPVQAACLYAKQNGFTNGGNSGNQSVKVTANTTALVLSATQTLHPGYWISVTVSEKLPLTFLSVLGQQYGNVSYQSIGGVWLPSAGGCIYTLGRNGTDVSMNGNTAISTGCGLYVDSNSSSAISIVGANGQITASGGASVNVVGNVSTHSPGQISPSANTGATLASDPFSGMTAPSTGACLTYSGQAVLDPGTYCNQISINNGTLTFNPGTYIFQNGIDIGGNATVNNNSTGGDGSGGVTFYVTGGNVNLHGTPSVTLNAPTSGTYKGILFWQASTDTNSANLKGGSSMFVNGVLYFPTAALTFNGGTAANATKTTIVSDTLSLVGNSYIKAAASTPYTGTSSGGAFLVQ